LFYRHSRANGNPVYFLYFHILYWIPTFVGMT
jgi:hypothetical protein